MPPYDGDDTPIANGPTCMAALCMALATLISLENKIRGDGAKQRCRARRGRRRLCRRSCGAYAIRRTPPRPRRAHDGNAGEFKARRLRCAVASQINEPEPRAAEKRPERRF
jgi:hypothetical protein